jgi:hypothetical protein
MDGKNSHGRRISLLNERESEWPVSNSVGRTSHSLPFHSRASSFASRSTSRNLSHSSTSNTSSNSNSGPPTPQLVRSGSSDSAEMQRTPSPLTPDLNFGIEGLAVSQKYADPATAFASSSPYNTAPAQHIQQYAPISAQPQPLPVAPYHARPSIGQKRSLYTAPQLPIEDTESSEPSTTSLRGSSRNAGPSRKNHYPCPLARQYSCQDYFTTSGHAARHAKKHTGRKDALCPECNKAFTRKDNMEQHRRTHQTGRKASRDSVETNSSSKRAKSVTKSAKPLAIQASPQVESAAPLSPARSYSSYADSSIGLAPQPYPDLSGQSGYAYPNPAAYYDTASLTGLDTLAIAASADASRSPPGC